MLSLWNRQWVALHGVLEDGINQIVIEGQRPEDGTSGIDIDDVEINYCPYFRKMEII